MKKVLFINVSTLIKPLSDQLENLEFYPRVFQYLSQIVVKLDYLLVLITSQPDADKNTLQDETFLALQIKIIQAFKNENVVFYKIINDNSSSENPTQNSVIEISNHFSKENFDLKNSFFITAVNTNVQSVENRQLKMIHVGTEINTTAVLNAVNWEDVYHFLKHQPRTAIVSRNTSETKIILEINLDGSGKSKIITGIGFFDHMLEQIARHGNIDLSVMVKGDLHIDEHHTIEDIGLTLGEALLKALGSKKGIERYGFLLPMDDCLAQVAIDFGGRPWLVWKVDFTREKIGDMPTEMFMHFFKSFSDTAKCNLNIIAEGINEHHKIEAVFKAFAKAIKMAIQKNNYYTIPSTKGSL